MSARRLAFSLLSIGKSFEENFVLRFSNQRHSRPSLQATKSVCSAKYWRSLASSSLEGALGIKAVSVCRSVSSGPGGHRRDLLSPPGKVHWSLSCLESHSETQLELRLREHTKAQGQANNNKFNRRRGCHIEIVRAGAGTSTDFCIFRGLPSDKTCSHAARSPIELEREQPPAPLWKDPID